MKNILHILVLLSISTLCHGQNGLNAKFSKEFVDAKPGSFFSVFLNVEKTDGKVFDDSLSASLTLPKGWRILSTKSPNQVIGKNNITYMFTLTNSGQTHSGKYTLVGNVFDSKKRELIYKTCEVNILRVRKVNVEPLDFPENVKEGDTLKVKYLVQNFGNDTEYLRFESDLGSFENFKLTDTLKLDSKQTTELYYKKIIGETKSNFWSSNISIKVFAKDSTEAIAQSVRTLPVFSTKLKKTDPYLRLPIQVGSSYAYYKFGTIEASGLQYDITGSGFLDFKNTHSIDFIIKGPNRFNIPIVGSYDMYYLHYNKGNKRDIQVGDFVLRIGNIFELGRFGRGIRIDERVGKGILTAYYTKPRFSFQERMETGVGYKIFPSQKFNISLNYLHKRFIPNNQSESSTEIIGAIAKYNHKNIW